MSGSSNAGRHPRPQSPVFKHMLVVVASEGLKSARIIIWLLGDRGLEEHHVVIFAVVFDFDPQVAIMQVPLFLHHIGA